MHTSRLTRPAFIAVELLLLTAVVVTTAFVSSAAEWHPAALVVVLMVLALGSEQFTVDLHHGALTPSTVAIVLAMALLGPAPAAACGVLAMALSAMKMRPSIPDLLNNVVSFAAVPFAGGLVLQRIGGDLHLLHSGQVGRGSLLGLLVLGVFMLALVANFALVGANEWVEGGRPLLRQLPEFIPLLPGELAAGALATILAVAYEGAGLPVLIAAMVLLAIFQHLTVALLRSEERAEHLQARSRQLVGLQLGVLRTLVRALGMRDETMGRHAAAVASYASALAHELGCGEDERDVVRAAALLHEIGKFTWPDRVLQAKQIDDADMAIVQSYPQEGSIIVGALDGYGPVADAILYHQERIDGRGYPAGLIGQEIPLASRILAVCSTYDTMVTREAYRPKMTPQEAMQELRIAARNGQLDPEIVEQLIALLEREGTTLADQADFETELEFERRVNEMAEAPSTATPSKRPLRALIRRRRTRVPPSSPQQSRH
jgi:HD-GYP domain-containing protein (c-di-GMP phosphodiesterase class II)